MRFSAGSITAKRTSLEPKKAQKSRLCLNKGEGFRDAAIVEQLYLIIIGYAVWQHGILKRIGFVVSRISRYGSTVYFCIRAILIRGATEVEARNSGVARNLPAQQHLPEAAPRPEL